jgi:hypothetical protein
MWKNPPYIFEAISGYHVCLKGHVINIQGKRLQFHSLLIHKRKYPSDTAFGRAPSTGNQSFKILLA